jgi:hypothetical protein
MDDPIVEEIHRIRDELSRKFNYDVHAIFEDLRAQEAQVKDRQIITVEESLRRAQSSSSSKI